ncbi:hypothetical protein ACFL5G_03120 [Candidatus Margulisiibacteriota bacterium]
MFVEIFILSILYLEAFLPFLTGKRFNFSSTFYWSRLRKDKFKTNFNTFAALENNHIIKKIFILITDNWFFKWFKKQASEPVSLHRKSGKSKLLLNNDLSQTKVSYVNNNNSYTGQAQKRTIC